MKDKEKNDQDLQVLQELQAQNQRLLKENQDLQEIIKSFENFKAEQSSHEQVLAAQGYIVLQHQDKRYKIKEKIRFAFAGQTYSAKELLQKPDYVAHLVATQNAFLEEITDHKGVQDGI